MGDYMENKQYLIADALKEQIIKDKLLKLQ